MKLTVKQRIIYGIIGFAILFGILFLERAAKAELTDQEKTVSICQKVVLEITAATDSPAGVMYGDIQVKNPWEDTVELEMPYTVVRPDGTKASAHAACRTYKGKLTGLLIWVSR